jgi:hypothetical protein
MDQNASHRPEELHPATAAILLFFEYEHLPLALQNGSRSFYALAHELVGYLDGPELTVALRKLLESKDCAVRAALPRKEGTPV